MNIKCPHCGTEYEVEQKDMYRYADCEACGNGFVVGTTTNFMANTETGHTPSSALAEQTVPSARPRTNRVGSGGMPSRPASFYIPARGKTASSRDGRSHFGHSVGYGVLGGVVLLGGILLLVSLRHKSEPEMKTATASSRDLMSESSPSGKSLEKVSTVGPDRIDVHPRLSDQEEDPSRSTLSPLQKRKEGKPPKTAVAQSAEPAGRLGELDGYRIGDVFDGVVAPDPHDPRPFVRKVQLGRVAGPFAGCTAELSYTPQTKKLAYMVICKPDWVKLQRAESAIDKMFREHYGLNKGLKRQFAVQQGARFNPPINPHGVCVGGIVYGSASLRENGERYTVACIASCELLKQQEMELDAIQDDAISKDKANTVSSTLRSFCGVEFGKSQYGSSSSDVIIWRNRELMTSWVSAHCNKFCLYDEQQGGEHGAIVRVTEQTERVFWISIACQGSPSIGTEGKLDEMNARVLADLSKKYKVTPYVLRRGSRYNTNEWRSDGWMYLFPVGNTSVYLTISGSAKLECIHDLLADSAIAEIEAEAKEIRVKDYDIFTKADFFGFSFGKVLSGRNPNSVLFEDAPDEDGFVAVRYAWDIQCREANTISVYATCGSKKTGKITASFAAVGRSSGDSSRDEFNILCEMLQSKLGVKPTIGKTDSGRIRAVFQAGEIEVELLLDFQVHFTAIHKGMLRQAQRELMDSRKKSNKNVAGIDAL